MSHDNGTFILLKKGVAICYSPKFHEHIVPRLNDEYEKDPGAEYVIVQVVGTVEKPKTPVIHSIYKAQS